MNGTHDSAVVSIPDIWTLRASDHGRIPVAIVYDERLGFVLEADFDVVPLELARPTSQEAA